MPILIDEWWTIKKSDSKTHLSFLINLLGRYEKYMDEWENFNKKSLAGKEEFHTNLNMEDFTYAGYMHAKREFVKTLK